MRSLKRALELRFPASDLAIGTSGVDVMTKSAGCIIAVLLDNQFAGQECQGDLAALSVLGNKGRRVAFNRCFAGGLTHVHALRQGVIDAAELDLQFVMAEGEDAKLVVVILVDSVRLRGRDDFGVLRIRELRVESSRRCR